MSWTRILAMCELWLWHLRYKLASRSWHTLGFRSTIVWNIIQIQLSSKKLWHGHEFLAMWALWPWPWRCDLGQVMTHSWVKVNNHVKYCPIQLSSKKLYPRQGFKLCVHYVLDLGDMTLGQCNDTPLGWGQQLCEILSRSNLAVRSCGPNK